MTRWANGEATIEQRITGAQADGGPWLAKARKTLRTATGILDDDPESAYVLIYDAARLACTGLPAQQGLRPTTGGGHYAVERAVRPQSGTLYKTVGTLRRRRNEPEYPAHPGDLVEAEEARNAASDAQSVLEVTTKLLPHLDFFGTHPG